MTIGHVITKMLMPERYHIALTAQLKFNGSGDLVPSSTGDITVPNNFEVAPGNFSKGGDSGALVTTVSTCPQPVGLLVAGNGPHTIVTSLPSVLQALQNAGGFSPLSVIPGGGGCTPALSQIQVPGGSSADFTLADATVADPDVAQALTVLPDFSSYLNLLIQDRAVDGIGIDLSGSTAALDVVWDSEADKDDNPIPPIPSSYEGAPVEQEIISTVDLTTDLPTYSY